MKTLTKLKQDLNVLILKSNIRTKKDVEKVNQVLSKINCIERWTIDLDDRERILKVESFMLSCSNISVILEKVGYQCSKLDH